MNREWTAKDPRVKSRFDERSHLSITGASGLILVAAGCYGLAFATRWGCAAILLALPCLFLLANVRTPRRAFYTGLAAGIAIYGPHLFFFWSIFRGAAIALWLVAGLPIAIFTLLLFLTRKRFGPAGAAVLTPVLWAGIEYFRSECYHLKFAWLLPGQTVAFLPGVRLDRIGVYGLGFLMATTGTLILRQSKSLRLTGLVAGLLLAIAMYVPPLPPADEHQALQVAGVQLELPSDAASGQRRSIIWLVLIRGHNYWC